jgi:hypothetical protein
LFVIGSSGQSCFGLYKVSVATPFNRHEFLVGSILDNTTLIQIQDPIGSLNRRDTVGNQEDGAI